MNWAFFITFFVISLFGQTIVIVPWFAIAVVPMLGAYYWVQRYAGCCDAEKGGGGAAVFWGCFFFFFFWTRGLLCGVWALARLGCTLT